MEKIRVSVLGSTGSIGTQALDVIAQHPQLFKVAALTAHTNGALLQQQAELFSAQFAQLTGGEDGRQVLLEAARVPADIVLISVSGMVGLVAVMECIRLGKDIALANKEVLVAGGAAVQQALRQSQTRIYPVDSEHSAIDQCLQGVQMEKVKNLWLTASGGPFRTWEKQRIATADLQDVLKHPTWNMGAKITVDSASMMNKGLEVIEAHWLFDLPSERIKVVVHPQSIVHSMIELNDNTLLAQMGPADMRQPIAYALNRRNRIACGSQPINLAQIGALTFEEPDLERFPCLGLARQALQAGDNYCTILNAANEEAVALFLQHKIAFGDIPEIVAMALEGTPHKAGNDLNTIFMADNLARQTAQKWATEVKNG